MNKIQTLMTMVFFLVLSTLLAGALTGFGTSTNIGVNTHMPEFGGTVLDIFVVVFQIIPFFFQLMTFQVTGIPAVINLVVFWPLSVGILFIIVSIIRGN